MSALVLFAELLDSAVNLPGFHHLASFVTSSSQQFARVCPMGILPMKVPMRIMTFSPYDDIRPVS